MAWMAALVQSTAFSVSDIVWRATRKLSSVTPSITAPRTRKMVLVAGEAVSWNWVAAKAGAKKHQQTEGQRQNGSQPEIIRTFHEIPPG
jgi:hypothetical protein